MDHGTFDRLAVALARRRGGATRRRLIASGFAGGFLAGQFGGTRADAWTATSLPARQECGLGCEDSICGEVPEDCPLFPRDSYWSVPIINLPVDDRSDDYVSSIGLDTGLHTDFGSGLYEGQPLGIPFVRVPADQEMVDITFEVADESDDGPYPIPVDVPIENGSCSDGDRHIIIVQEGTCTLYEVFSASPLHDGTWTAFGGAKFDLTSNDLRPDEWTSADAAGLPILPGLVRYEEIEAGEIPHALRFTASLTRDEYVWPARHQAGASSDPNVPPMGQRFRLKADVEIDEFSATNQIILQALKTYGMLLADNGSDWFLSGVPDDRWDNDDLRELRELITGKDFEAVDCSGLMGDPDSGAVA